MRIIYVSFLLFLSVASSHLIGQNFPSTQNRICNENLLDGFIPPERGVKVLPYSSTSFLPVYDTAKDLYVTIKNVDYFNIVDNHDVINNNNSIVIDSLSDQYFFQFMSFQEKKIPTSFLEYILDYYRPFYYGLVTIVDRETKQPANLPSTKRMFSYFPDSIKTFENSFLFIKRNPSFFGCTSERYATQETPFHSAFNKCFSQTLDLSFGFFEGIYKSKLYCLWESEYKMYLRCRKIKETENCKEVRKKIKDEIEVSSQNEYLMHKSYFELVLWQLYQPDEFKVKDDRGKKKSFIFTSNNPEYPGSYEVKFNIYEPYKFKVFKR